MSNLDKNKDFLRNYARYSSLALQMGIIIVGGSFGGYFIDQSINMRYPIFTVILALISVVISLYLVIKELNK